MFSIEGRDVVIVLTVEGQRCMEELAIEVPKGPLPLFRVEAHDEMGIWIRFRRADGDHISLIRWAFIRALDVTAGEARTEGGLGFVGV